MYRYKDGGSNTYSNKYSKKVFIKISEMPDDNIKMIRVCLVPLKKTIQFLYINDKKQLKNNRSA